MTSTTAAPASARPVLKFSPRPVRVAVKGIKALAESSELSSSDEIYLVIVAVDLTNTPVPGVRAVMTGTWGDVDTGEFHPAVQIPPGTPESTIDALGAFAVVARPIWPLAGGFAPIRHPDDVVFVVACMEHDDGDPDAARVIVQTAAVASVGGALGVPRATLVANLRNDIDSALKTPTGLPDFDNQVGKAKELRLTAKHIALTVPGVPFEESVFFYGGDQDEGHVRADFVFTTAKA